MLDISYAIGIVSRFMHSRKEIYLEAVYRILLYLMSQEKEFY